MLTLTSFGACEEVTGSKHLLEIDNQKFLIDCGIWQGEPDSEIRNKNFKLKIPASELDGVFLTHAHADHCGLLPSLVNQGYDKKIWCTPATRDLASIIMLDCAKISELYSSLDVLNTLNIFRCHFYGKKKRINDNISFSFYDAGHILGSSLIDFEINESQNFIQKILKLKKEPRHILFTGDLGRDSNPISWPPEKNIPAPDTIVMESTYGNRLHSDSETSLSKLADIVNKTMERGGKVLIPSFALERTQEIIYHLKILMTERRIKRVPVYLDSPMATNITGIFSIHINCWNKNLIKNFLEKDKNPFSISTLQIVKSSLDSEKLARSKKPCIIISANGMCESGRITNHLRSCLGDPKNSIVFVGFNGENTIGRKIQDKNEEVEIQGKKFPIKIEVETLDAFSSHADYSEIVQWIKNIDNSKLKRILLVHGDSEASSFLKDILEKEFPKVKVDIVKKDFEKIKI